MNVSDMKEWLEKLPNEMEVVAKVRLSGSANWTNEFEVSRVFEHGQPDRALINITLDKYCDYEKGIA